MVLLPLGVCIVCCAWTLGFLLASAWLLNNFSVYTAVLMLPWPPLALLSLGVGAFALQTAVMFLAQWATLGSIAWLDETLRDIVRGRWV